MLRFSGAGRSDVGPVRPDNEDAGFVGPYVALVADGVGGAAAGEVASATAAHAVVATALARFPGPPCESIRAGAEAAGRGIRRGIQRHLDRLGMATTLTVLVTDGRDVALGHVGDSRAYRLRGGVLEQLSVDHTYGQQLLARGQLAPERVRVHPWRQVVMRSLDGDPADPGIDVVPVGAEPADRFLLCSDGLSDAVGEEVIAELVGLGRPDTAADVLTEAALAAGGRDNVTCVVLDVVDGPRVPGDGCALGALADPRNVVDALGLRLGRSSAGEPAGREAGDTSATPAQ